MENKLSFIQETYKSIFIIFLISMYGIARENSMVMLLVAILLLFIELRTNKNNVFYWSFFLIPNIRFLDTTSVKFLVNFLMVIPIVKYTICYDFFRKRFLGILFGLALFLFEVLHIVYFETYDTLFPTIAWGLSFSLCIMASTDKSIAINKGDIYDSLSVGIIFSSLLYLIAEPKSVFTNYYNFTERFIAYADDPNYFSLYILYCLSTWILIDKKKYRFGTFAIVAFIGFLTSSKMEFILSSLIFIYIAIDFFRKNNVKGIIKKLPLILFVLIIFVSYKIETILDYCAHILTRMGGVGASIDTITTGRFHLQMYYLNDFVESFSDYILGFGFTYFRFLGEPSVRGAHNTYIDILVAWGIIGSIFFFMIIYLWVLKSKRVYIQNKHLKSSAYFPIIIFCLVLCSLSCFSANMFPFMLMAVFPFLNKNRN